MRLYVSKLQRWLDPADLFLLLYADSPNSFWLDREFHPTEPVSVIGAGKKSAANLIDLKFDTNQDIELPFSWRPGVVGAISYEGENLFIEVDRAFVFDHAAQAVYFVGLFNSETEFVNWKNAAFLRFGLRGGELAAYRIMQSKKAAVQNTRLRHNAAEYLALINKAQEHIALGDVYQICLTNEISMQVDADPFNTFLNLRELNPAPYASFLKFDETAVVCSSPEQFLQVTASGDLSTKPIKGTRPRNPDPLVDARNSAELAANEKERAENLMIVDLMRNDFGRVAQSESVSVSKLFEVESYATVHQLVSTIEANLAAGQTAATAIAACFPGGSMTGAPKLRAMEIIRDLEGGERGIYSGVNGFIGFNGAADLGMTIRTIVFRGGSATIGIGGGITSDSEPYAELEETKLKARALLKALNAPDPWG